jgi:hypothetical protein
MTADDLPAYIGRYQVLKRLGEGATRDIVLARDPFQGQEVGIKRMRSWAPAPDAPASDFSNRFFSAEAAPAGRLNHKDCGTRLATVVMVVIPVLAHYLPGL